MGSGEFQKKTRAQFFGQKWSVLRGFSAVNTITHGPLQKKHSHGLKLFLAHKSVGI